MNSRYDRILLLTEGKSSVSIEYLAAALCISYQDTLQLLQQMMREGLFPPAAYINYLTRAVVLDNDLSQTVSQTARSVQDGVAQAVEGISEAFHTISQQARAAAKSSGQTNSRASERAKRNTTAKAGYTYSYSYGTGNTAKKAAPPGRKVKKCSTAASVLLFITAGILILVGCVNLLEEIDYILWAGSMSMYSLTDYIIPSALAIAGGIGIIIGRNFVIKRNRRLMNYIPMLSGKQSISIAQLASFTNLPASRVTRDLSYMLSRGMLGSGAFIDLSTKTLLLDGRASEPQAEKPQKPEKPATPENQYYIILQEIRTLNDEILDAAVSDRIDKIEELTAKFFRIVEEKPEKQPQIKSFMSYYLPTTLKLLRSYRTFEKQGIAGENIETAKQDIERILDTLVKGFARQLDQLFKDEALDISTDIEVLSSMMAKDGLVSDAGGFGTAVKPQ